MFQGINYRLPRHIIPKTYKLILRPDLPNKTFGGIVTISVETTEPTNKITLHSNKLNITSTTLKNKQNADITLAKTVTIPDEREFFIVHLEKSLPKGIYELSMEFSGRLDRGFIGFYSSSLKNGG